MAWSAIHYQLAFSHGQRLTRVYTFLSLAMIDGRATIFVEEEQQIKGTHWHHSWGSLESWKVPMIKISNHVTEVTGGIRQEWV